MAITPRSGSLTGPSPDNTAPSDIPNTQNDVTMGMPYVGNSVLNELAIDTTQYPKATADVLGLMKGKRINVTYYRTIKTGGSNIRTNIADYPNVINILNTEYDKILNMEITLTKGFEFTANPENSSASITGTAFMYPNSNPSIGDIFTTSTGDGRIGIFRISKIEIASWRNDRPFLVNFAIQSFADPSDIQTLDAMATRELVFDKANFLGGTAALITQSTYLQLQKVKVLRSNLFEYYHSLFYDRAAMTYFRDDGIYDPLVTLFMSNKWTMDDNLERPKNLLGRLMEDYKKSIWYRIEDRYNPTLYGLYTKYLINPYSLTKMSAFNTELVNKYWISLNSSDDNPEYYVFSADFYNGSINAMSDYEKAVFGVITTRLEPDLATLIGTYLETVYTLSPSDAYYRIPIYIHMCDMAMDNRTLRIDSTSMNYASTE